MLGHVAGAPVVLASSSLLAVVALTAIFAPSVRAVTGLDAGAYVVAGAFVVLLFGSVLVHELAHGLVARARGQQPHAFVLTLWGGHTTFGGADLTPATSALIAVVGPIANLVLAGLFLLAGALLPDGSLTGWLAYSGAFANGFVGVFNLVPGLPLDGGRVLEAAVWAATKDRARGLRVAGWTGRAVAVVVLAWAVGGPLLRGGQPNLGTVIWAGLVAAVLWSGASGAVQDGRRAQVTAALAVSTVGRPAVGVPHTWSVLAAGEAVRSAGATTAVVLSPDGRPAAYVDPAAAASVPAEAVATTPVTAVSVPLPVGAEVDGRLTGQPLLQALAQATRLSPVVVALVDGRVVALVHAPDVVAALRT